LEGGATVEDEFATVLWPWLARSCFYSFFLLLEFLFFFSNSFTTISAGQKFAEHMFKKSLFGTEILKDEVS